MISLTVCDRCGKTIQEADKYTQVIPPGKDSPVYLCEECSQIAYDYFKATTEKKPIDSSLGVVILYGFVAAVLCSLTWYGCVIYTHFQFGFIAIAVGYFVAFAVVEGSKTLNGQQLKWISAGLTLFAMIFSQYLISHYYYSAYLILEGYQAPSLLLPLDEVAYIIFTDVINDPASLFFWLLAVSEAYILPVRWRPR